MGQMHYSVQALLSAQFGPEFHAQVVALSKCPQMISQHVRTMVHTGMDAGSVFLKVSPSPQGRRLGHHLLRFKKRLSKAPPPPYFRLYHGSKMSPLPPEQQVRDPPPLF